jgi:hypothetical protein
MCKKRNKSKEKMKQQSYVVPERSRLFYEQILRFACKIVSGYACEQGKKRSEQMCTQKQETHTERQ